MTFLIIRKIMRGIKDRSGPINIRLETFLLAVVFDTLIASGIITALIGGKR